MNHGCRRCIHDSSLPGVSFNLQRGCNFCELHDKWEKDFPLDERGSKMLQQTIETIKKHGKGKKFDCIIGISGGRDSTYLLYLAVKEWGLRPLAVHFNDGFDIPVAGENMIKATKKLGVELRTITSDWREAKDLCIDFLKDSVPDMNQGTDIGIASSLFGMASKENVKYILFGQSFRTEGIKPISWTYFDGDYLRSVHKQFGTVPLRKWTPDNPGFHLGIKEMFYYSVFRRIKVFTPLYLVNYVRKDADKLLIKELDWVYPGAHYFDDLYWSLINFVQRVKFNIDIRMNSYAALVRSGQMDREEAINSVKQVYAIEDPKIISLCIKRLGLTQKDFDEFMKLPPKTFKDYPTSYRIMR